jgi:hypothetical protein
MDDKIKLYSFYAAVMFVLIGLVYCFILIWLKPTVDLATPILGLVMLLIGYYWGTSKSSADKDKTIEKTIQNAADIAVMEEKKE